MRPGKFRFVALMHFIGLFNRPNVSVGPPRQAAQLAFSVICTPAATRISQIVWPSQRAVCKSWTISGVAAIYNRNQYLPEMREAIERGGFSALHFKWGLGLNVVYFVFAIVFFRWMFESARSRGLLVKME